jgi:outer membrane protein assembly factor BamB
MRTHPDSGRPAPAPRTRRRAVGGAVPVAVLALVGTALAGLGGAWSGNASASTVTAWPVYHGDAAGSGVAAGSTTFHGAAKAWTSRRLSGQIFGEPLVANGDVIVATETDAVYALSASTGKVVWSKQVGVAVPAKQLPCGNIRPKVGITSTPVIDTARSEVFVVADAWVHRTITHQLVGLSLATGTIVLDQVVDPPGTTPAAQLQRAALTLDGGNVIISSGGNAGDCGSYHGWVVSVPETGGPLHTFDVDPTTGNDEGAIWMGGAAPTIDGSGNIWVATGNGSNTSGPNPDYSDSVVELSASLVPLQTFTPSAWAAENANDLDLGSMAPALLPGGEVLQAGKSQTAYLLDQSALGGVGGQQAALTSFCGADVDGGSAVVGSVVYTPCLQGVEAVSVQTGPPSMTELWQTSTAGGPPIVAGGLVWTVSHGRGVLYGLDPATGAEVTHFPLGAVANHFPTPSAADGLILVASSTKVHAFRLTT